MTLDAESRQLLQDSARDWFTQNSSIIQFRAQRDSAKVVSGVECWDAIVQLGWTGLMVPEELGGSGLEMTEMGLILEQAGRKMSPIPLLSCAVIGAAALRSAADNDFVRTQLQAIATGELRIALAIDETPHHRPGNCESVASKTAGGWIINSGKTRVADALGANAYLVSARLEGSDTTGLFLVEADQVERQSLHLIDSRDHGSLQLRDVAVGADALLQPSDDTIDLLSHVLNYARIGLATEMLGSAWAAFDMTVEYMKLREQFGQLIGSFQSLQHRAAEMYVDLELSRSAVDAALISCANNDADLAAIACKTKMLVGETLHRVSNEAVQLHGGIGMTDEHDAGLYLKRARVSEQLYGSASFLRDQFASLRRF